MNNNDQPVRATNSEALTNDDNLLSLEEGFYILTKDGEYPSLVKVYTNPNTNTKGIGFGIWDGCGFLPLEDIHKNSNLIKINLEQYPDLDKKFVK